MVLSFIKFADGGMVDVSVGSGDVSRVATEVITGDSVTGVEELSRICGCLGNDASFFALRRNRAGYLLTWLCESFSVKRVLCTQVCYIPPDLVF